MQPSSDDNKIIDVPEYITTCRASVKLINRICQLKLQLQAIGHTLPALYPAFKVRGCGSVRVVPPIFSANH